VSWKNCEHESRYLYAFVLKCCFEKQQESDILLEREVAGVFKTIDKVVTTIREWIWKFEVEYELFAFLGNSPEQKVRFCVLFGFISSLFFSQVDTQCTGW
jgi:hypothetical protein